MASLNTILAKLMPVARAILPRTEQVFAEPERVHDPLHYGKLNISVQHTDSPANYMIPYMMKDFVYPQSQQEHDDLLNQYISTAKFNPNWRQMGEQSERNYAKYSDRDTAPRQDIMAASSVIQNIEYDPSREIATLRMGGKDYSYNATPDELYAFLAAGSLGREMNDIKHGNSHSLRRL